MTTTDTDDWTTECDSMAKEAAARYEQLKLVGGYTLLHLALWLSCVAAVLLSRVLKPHRGGYEERKEPKQESSAESSQGM